MTNDQRKKTNILNHPSISIITITYNAEAVLEETMLSIIGQTYPNVEYLVIDGKSKDRTLEIVEKYKEHVHQVVSEPDKGLYDAMNKGIRHATGDYIIFMNAGDFFYEPTTLEKVFNSEQNADIYYGETMLIDEEGKDIGLRSEKTTRKLPEQLTWKKMQRGMVVCHQSFIVKREIAPFYIENNLSADIDWVIKCLKVSKKTVNTQTIIARYLLGGVSQQRHVQSLKDRYKVFQDHYGFLPNLFNHFLIVLRSFSSKLSKRDIID